MYVAVGHSSEGVVVRAAHPGAGFPAAADPALAVHPGFGPFQRGAAGVVPDPN